MKYLKQSLQVKGFTLHNRLVLPPIETSKSKDGSVSEELCKYYDEKSSGGYFGLIVTEHAYIKQGGKASAGQLSVADVSCIDGLSKLASIVHKNGSKIIAQISHAGSGTSKSITGKDIVSASGIQFSHRTNEIPRPLTKREILDIVKAFADSAKNVKQAGFDGVEIHAAHGYLLNQFFSPITNKRDDEYNGTTLDGRIRIHLEIIGAIRETVGNEFIVALRLGASDYMSGGTTIGDSIVAAKAFEKAGVDIIDISGGLCGYTHPNKKEQGYFAELSQPIKEATAMPVILTGGIVDGAAAERLLVNGQADLIGIGRAALRDSQWAKKAIMN